MATNFSDVLDWSQVPAGEQVFSRSVQAKDHVRAYAETTQVWNGVNNTLDVGFYAYEKRSVEFRYNVQQANPVTFGPAQTFSSSELVEYGQVKMPVEAAVGLVASILEILQAYHPAQYNIIATQLGNQPLGQ